MSALAEYPRTVECKECGRWNDASYVPASQLPPGMECLGFSKCECGHQGLHAAGDPAVIANVFSLLVEGKVEGVRIGANDVRTGRSMRGDAFRVSRAKRRCT